MPKELRKPTMMPKGQAREAGRDDPSDPLLPAASPTR